MLGFFARTRAEINQEAETKKKIEEARRDSLLSELKEIEKNYRFPKEVPEVGQCVRVVYKNNSQIPMILEGIVVSRVCRNQSQRCGVQVSSLKFEDRIGTQDFLLVTYDGNSEWQAKDGSPIVLTALA